MRSKEAGGCLLNEWLVRWELELQSWTGKGIKTLIGTNSLVWIPNSMETGCDVGDDVYLHRRIWSAKEPDGHTQLTHQLGVAKLGTKRTHGWKEDTQGIMVCFQEIRPLLISHMSRVELGVRMSLHTYVYDEVESQETKEEASQQRSSHTDSSGLLGLCFT
ncbi:unnamed protein product [Pleuronectes platessa]|uniref:Uncharacterized protein n=1 Tax=Pleuronectes platessa TaxID=8262 RepID=A0A9N7YZT9_PLEPL|nr:unnamed protein product [Pleuronectes platessa]